VKLHSGRDHESALSEINVTPLVDVMLVLLIIFMVAAPMMNRGIDVDLPATASADPLDDERIEITLDTKGQLWLGDREVHEDFLRDEMRKLSRARPGTGVFLKADAKSAYGSVLRVMDLIRTSGVTKIAMITMPAPPPEPREGR